MDAGRILESELWFYQTWTTERPPLPTRIAFEASCSLKSRWALLPHLDVQRTGTPSSLVLKPLFGSWSTGSNLHSAWIPPGLPPGGDPVSAHIGCELLRVLGGDQKGM